VTQKSSRDAVRDRDLAERLAAGQTPVDIAEAYGISYQRVHQLAVRLGVWPMQAPAYRRHSVAARERVEARARAKFHPAYEAWLAAGHGKGKRVAAEYGLSQGALSSYARQRGLPRPVASVPEHGDRRRYYFPKYACRCDLCRTAARAYSRAHRGVPPERWRGPYKGEGAA
jgi:hypothetical protein